MYGDTWQVRWKEFLSDSYVYGSKIEFNEDGSVSYKNRLMPPGTVIHTWYSMTNFQGNRIEPSLPLIDGERAYSIAVNIDYHNSESEALMLRIIFFDRYDVQAQSIIVRDKKAFFKPSIRTYSYRIELINGGNADFTFKSLVIKEVSEEEFDAEQERIERLKEDSNKSKKKRRKNIYKEITMTSKVALITGMFIAAVMILVKILYKKMPVYWTKIYLAEAAVMIIGMTAIIMIIVRIAAWRSFKHSERRNRDE